jgi:hypothetical protein
VEETATRSPGGVSRAGTRKLKIRGKSKVNVRKERKKT